MPDSFYEPDGELYVSTELTRGPWDPGAQDAGPPAALIGREVERLGGGRIGGEGGPPAQVGRITYEAGEARAAGTCSSTWTSRFTCTGCPRASGSAWTPMTLPEPNGIGMADTRLLDEQGPIGRAAQTLLVAERT